MKAIVYHAYGAADDVLELGDIDKPVIASDEVLVRVRAAAVNPGDWFFLRGKPYVIRMMAGPFKPRNEVLGRAVAGMVEAVGGDVRRFRPGDEVYAEVSHGGFAAYARVSEDAAALKPASLTFGQAAAVPPVGVTALVALRDIGQVRRGQRVLINGASGGVGTFAVQIAKAQIAVGTEWRRVLREARGRRAISWIAEPVTNRDDALDMTHRLDDGPAFMIAA